MEKVMEKSWNVMEFGFENCVGTLFVSCSLTLIDNNNQRFAVVCYTP